MSEILCDQTPLSRNGLASNFHRELVSYVDDSKERSFFMSLFLTKLWALDYICDKCQVEGALMYKGPIPGQRLGRSPIHRLAGLNRLEHLC